MTIAETRINDNERKQLKLYRYITEFKRNRDTVGGFA